MNLLLEVKTPEGRLTPAQKDFFENWTGQKAVVVTVSDVKQELKKYMPTYEYKCISCGHVLTLKQAFKSEHKMVLCPKCNARHMTRTIQVPEIVFRGDGWANKDIHKKD